MQVTDRDKLSLFTFAGPANRFFIIILPRYCSKKKLFYWTWMNDVDRAFTMITSVHVICYYTFVEFPFGFFLQDLLSIDKKIDV